MSTNHISKALADQIHEFEKARRLEEERDFYLDLILEEELFNLEDFPEKYKNDLEIVLAAIGCDSSNLQFASDELKNDREFVLQAVQVDGRRALEFASDAFRGDEEIVLEAIAEYHCEFLIELASDELKKDRNFVLKAVQRNSGVLAFLPQHYWADQEILIAALRNFWSLEFAPDEVRANREIVLASVEIYGGELEYASDELRDDREIVSEAIERQSSVLRYASEVKQAIFHDFHAIICASHSLKNDLDILATAIYAFRRQRNRERIRLHDVETFLIQAGFRRVTLCWQYRYMVKAIEKQNGVHADLSFLEKLIRSAPNKHVACTTVRFYVARY